MPGPDSSTVSGVIPAAWETVLNDLQKAEWDGTGDPVSRSQKVREAMELWLAAMKAEGRLPADSLDDVDGLDPEAVLNEYNLKHVGVEADDGKSEAVNA